MDILRARSAEIHDDGVYLGLLEWVVFSVLEMMTALMLFGEYVLNVGQVFAPALCPCLDSARVCRVAAVRVGPKGKLLSAVGASGACYPDINHYVIGQEASGPVDVSPPAGQVSVCAHRCALRANWILRDTVMQGDCAPDCMVHSLGLQRTEASRQCVRRRISDFLLNVAEDPAWHAIALACEGRAAEVAADSGKTGGLGPLIGAPSGLTSIMSHPEVAKPCGPAPPLVDAPPSPPTEEPACTIRAGGLRCQWLSVPTRPSMCRQRSACH